MGETVTEARQPQLSGEAMDERTDEVLLERFVDGDEAAFDELVLRYKREMVTYLERMVGDAGWAEDLAQDVFLKVYLKAGAFRARARFSTWLYRIAHNRAVDFLKRRKHEPRLVLHGARETGADDREMPILDARGGPQECSSRRELEGKILDVVNGMDEKYRTVFVLCAMQRLSYEEAAEVTDLPVKTVSSRLCRARKLFRAKVRPYLDVPF